MVTATAIATPRLRVPNSAANVNRSRGSAVTIAAAIHPAATEHTMNTAASGTVVGKASRKALGIVQDDEDQHEPDADERQALQCGLVPWPDQRRRAHIPSATGRVNISRSWVIRLGLAPPLCGRHLEEPANGWHSQPAKQTREARERHRQCRRRAPCS